MKKTEQREEKTTEEEKDAPIVCVCSTSFGGGDSCFGDIDSVLCTGNRSQWK